MIGIGVSQIKSIKPVGFYSGEKAPQPEELSDVKAWNTKHGIMWIAFGLIIMISWFVGFLIRDELYSSISLCIGAILPVFFMMAYHNKLIKQYKIEVCEKE